jgi:hypothetical protein
MASIEYLISSNNSSTAHRFQRLQSMAKLGKVLQLAQLPYAIVKLDTTTALFLVCAFCRKIASTKSEMRVGRRNREEKTNIDEGASKKKSQGGSRKLLSVPARFLATLTATE